jgi:hypothetical protein
MDLKVIGISLDHLLPFKGDDFNRIDFRPAA